MTAEEEIRIITLNREKYLGRACTEEEKKAEEYASVIRSLKKGKSIRDTAKLCDVSISTVQRVKREFAL